jgi:rubrerythrin
MAQYQTTSELHTCEKCGETEYDIVPDHDCPIEFCELCLEEFDTRDYPQCPCIGMEEDLE